MSIVDQHGDVVNTHPRYHRTPPGSQISPSVVTVQSGSTGVRDSNDGVILLVLKCSGYTRQRAPGTH